MTAKPSRRAALAARRAALAKRERVAKRPAVPLDVAEAYAASLRSLNRELAAEVRAFVRPWLDARREEQREAARIAREDAAGDLDFGLLRVRLEKIAKDRALDLVDRFGRRINRWNVEDLAAVLRIDIDAEPPAILRLLEAWRRENVGLIESIAKRLHGDVRDVVRAGAREGTRVETIADQIRDRFGVSESRANLIARDQILKGNADLTVARASEVGITHYRWSTSHDERVRGNPSGKWPKGLHYALDGKIFAFAEPPIVNLEGDRANPGTDYQCRCVAIPILGD